MAAGRGVRRGRSSTASISLASAPETRSGCSRGGGMRSTLRDGLSTSLSRTSTRCLCTRRTGVRSPWLRSYPTSSGRLRSRSFQSRSLPRCGSPSGRYRGCIATPRSRLSARVPRMTSSSVGSGASGYA